MREYLARQHRLLPRRANRSPGATDQLRLLHGRLRLFLVPAGLGEETLEEHKDDEREYVYTRQQTRRRRDPRRILERGDARDALTRATCTTTCGCTGERRSWSGRRPPSTPTKPRSTSTTSISSTGGTPTPSPTWPGSSASPRPGLDGARDLRQGPLHVRRRPGAEGQTGTVRC